MVARKFNFVTRKKIFFQKMTTGHSSNCLVTLGNLDTAFNNSYKPPGDHLLIQNFLIMVLVIAKGTVRRYNHAATLIFRWFYTTGKTCRWPTTNTSASTARTAWSIGTASGVITRRTRGGRSRTSARWPLTSGPPPQATPGFSRCRISSISRDVSHSVMSTI